VTAQSPAGPQPRTIQVTWVSLLVAAAFSVITPLAYFTGRSWLEQQQHDNVTKKAVTGSYTAADRAKDLEPANIANAVSRGLTAQLVYGVIIAALLVYFALSVRKGRHWTRWGIIGLWIVLSLLIGSPIGLSGFIFLGTTAPAFLKIAAFLGASAFIVALIAVNLPSSIQYLNANRPPRPAGAPAGGGLGALFRPRPMTPPEPTKPAPARTTQPTKLAPTRPAQPTKPAQPVQRTKAKSRPASTESAGQQAPPTSPTPKNGGTGRSRGKSRGR